MDLFTNLRLLQNWVNKVTIGSLVSEIFVKSWCQGNLERYIKLVIL